MYAYRCGTLIDGTGADAIDDAALVIGGGRVVSKGSWQEWLAARSGARATETFRECTVIPGLIDAHTHLCSMFGTGAGVGALEGDVETAAWGLAAGLSALRCGITTVVDLGSPGGLAIQVSGLMQRGLAAGPTVVPAGPAITTTAGHGVEIGMVADSVVEIRRAVRRCIDMGAQIIKIMLTGGAVDRTPTNRRRAQYSLEELSAAVDDAHRLGVRVVTHANATEGIALAVQAGVDVVAHCNWLDRAPGAVKIDESVVDEMIKQGTRVDLNIGGALRDLAKTDGEVIDWPYGSPSPKTRWELFAPMLSRGLQVHLTSDAHGPTISTFPRRLCELRQRWGLSAEVLVNLACGAPADAIGIAGERGTLTPGSIADFVVLKGDLRKDNDALAEPVVVFQAGQEVARGGWVGVPPVVRGASEMATEQDAAMPKIFEQLS